MKSTIIRRLKQLCLLFAFSSTLADGLNDVHLCSSTDLSFEQFDKQIQDIKNCLEELSEKWTSYQHSKFFNQLQTMTGIIQKQEHKAFQKLLPENCSAPVVPENGGLLCGSVKNKLYCKPMCNAGYDFSFSRRSRLYEECSAATKHTWTTQFIGGNRLAICNKSHISVSGAPTAYFPEGLDCHKIKSDEQLIGSMEKSFQSELGTAGITQAESFWLLCG